MGEIIYKDLSYQVMGSVFRVFKKLGFGYREKYYQRAIEEELKIENLGYVKECCVKLEYNRRIIGRYFIDFVIEDKIALEIKIATDFYTKDVKQLLSYLKAKDLKLGILLIITKDGMRYKRIAN